MAAQKVMKRQEADKKYTWAIEDIYASDAQWQEEFEEVEKSIPQLETYAGRLASDADTLLAFMNLFEHTGVLNERILVYANQKYHEDTSNSVYQNLTGKASNLAMKLSSALAFAVPELVAEDPKKIEEFYKQKPELKKYENYISNILRRREHTLSKELEEVIASASEVLEGPSNIFSMFNNADIKFPEIKDEEGNLVQITQGRYGTLMESKDRRVREDAFHGMYSVYKQYKNTLAATYSTNVKAMIFESKTRKYNSNIEAALDATNVPVSVYHNLLEVVHDNMDLMHRYVALRKKALGVDELHMYDIYVPMVKAVDMKIPYEEAKKTVYDALEVLGDDYRAKLQEAFDHGWIDVYENEGKRTGAYSWGPYGTHPYVLLNYQENLDNMFTLAHEMGHAMHSYYSDKALPYLDAGYKIFVAEVASTCNEALLMEYLLGKTDDKMERAYLINHFLDQFKGTLYRQTMFAEFEMITHAKAEAGESLTADELCTIYHGLNKKYYGEDMVSDDDIALEWAKIPHFYTPFYVYQYATGYSAAIAISRRILKEGAPAVEDYKKFLSGGCSKNPIELLKIAGVDMSTKEPIQQALDLFASLLDEMEELLK